MLMTACFFLLLSLLNDSEQCLKTLPPEEVYITATSLPGIETTTVNLCNDCDIDEIIQDQGGDKVVPNDVM
uniref:Uncharacterized protein n=1 Tax=Caenorhabditis japonica TaxID=281687 RepID=A0A8R1E301_CAEJA